MGSSGFGPVGCVVCPDNSSLPDKCICTLDLLFFCTRTIRSNCTLPAECGRKAPLACAERQDEDHIRINLRRSTPIQNTVAVRYAFLAKTICFAPLQHEQRTIRIESPDSRTHHVFRMVKTMDPRREVSESKSLPRSTVHFTVHELQGKALKKYTAIAFHSVQL